MKRADILKNLNEKNLNFSIVAEALDVAPGHVSAVAGRKATSKRVADALAKAIDKPLDEVFDDVPEYHVAAIKPRSERVASLKELVA